MHQLGIYIVLFVLFGLSSCSEKVGSSDYYGSWVGTADCPGASYFDSNASGLGIEFRTDAFPLQVNLNDSFGNITNDRVFMEAFLDYGFCPAPENLVWQVDGRNLSISIDETLNDGTESRVIGSATLSEDLNTLSVNYSRYRTWSNASTCDIICNFVLTRQ